MSRAALFGGEASVVVGALAAGLFDAGFEAFSDVAFLVESLTVVACSYPSVLECLVIGSRLCVKVVNHGCVGADVSMLLVLSSGYIYCGGMLPC